MATAAENRKVGRKKKTQNKKCTARTPCLSQRSTERRPGTHPTQSVHAVAAGSPRPGTPAGGAAARRAAARGRPGGGAGRLPGERGRPAPTPPPPPPPALHAPPSPTATRGWRHCHCHWTLWSLFTARPALTLPALLPVDVRASLHFIVHARNMHTKFHPAALHLARRPRRGAVVAPAATPPPTIAGRGGQTQRPPVAPLPPRGAPPLPPANASSSSPPSALTTCVDDGVVPLSRGRAPPPGRRGKRARGDRRENWGWGRREGGFNQSGRPLRPLRRRRVPAVSAPAAAAAWPSAARLPAAGCHHRCRCRCRRWCRRARHRRCRCRRPSHRRRAGPCRRRRSRHSRRRPLRPMTAGGAA